ncbi:MAG: hypothetical protein WBX01_09390 [Nitrososphaeraceae archaeon]
MWTADDWDILRLKMMVFSTWNLQSRRDAVGAIASYGKPALPALTEIATWTWNEEFRAYVLDKIKQINNK